MRSTENKRHIMHDTQNYVHAELLKRKLILMKISKLDILTDFKECRLNNQVA
jgi:hypothetical protein